MPLQFVAGCGAAIRDPSIDHLLAFVLPLCLTLRRSRSPAKVPANFAAPTCVGVILPRGTVFGQTYVLFGCPSCFRQEFMYGALDL